MDQIDDQQPYYFPSIQMQEKKDLLSASQKDIFQWLINKAPSTGQILLLQRGRDSLEALCDAHPKDVQPHANHSQTDLFLENRVHPARPALA